VQCTDRRQICVDDACIREERVRAADLTLGDWRILTPESTDENPFATIESLSASSRVVLDEDGEVGFAGSARDTAGRTVLFSVGQEFRMVTPSDGESGSLLPYRGGFLAYKGSPGGVVFYGADGTAQWTATPRTTGLPPYESGVVGYFRPMVHTPSGPMLIAVAALNTRDPVYEIIDMQRLDLDGRRFADVPFVDGPHLTGASIGQPVMGPTGFELILGRADGDARPSLSVYTVATGEERPIGDGAASWDIAITPLAGADWVGVLELYDLPAGGCGDAAIGSNGAEIARLTREESECAPFPASRPRSAAPRESFFKYVRSATRSAWVRNGEDSLDGVVWSRSEWGTVRSSIAGSRYGKTFEIMGLDPFLYATPGVYIAERQLRSGGEGL